jgi:hypothetical protein
LATWPCPPANRLAIVYLTEGLPMLAMHVIETGSEMK